MCFSSAQIVGSGGGLAVIHKKIFGCSFPPINNFSTFESLSFIKINKQTKKSMSTVGLIQLFYQIFFFKCKFLFLGTLTFTSAASLCHFFADFYKSFKFFQHEPTCKGLGLGLGQLGLNHGPSVHTMFPSFARN